MGMCKCRKRTQLFCFVHKKAVCEDCVVDHAVCVVGKYMEWLKDGSHDPPSCAVCNELFTDVHLDGSSTLRLPCLHVVHTQCLDDHAQSLPNYTALAGYQCPLCSVPFIPALDGDNPSRLQTVLLDHITSTEWGARFKPQSRTTPNEDALPSSASAPVAAQYASSDGVAVTTATGSLSRKGARGGDLLSRSQSLANPGGSAARADGYDDVDGDKYTRKRPLMSLLSALGIVQGGGTLIDMRRLVLLFCLITASLIVWVVMVSAGGSDSADGEGDEVYAP